MRFCPYCGGDISSHLAVVNKTTPAPATQAFESEEYDQDKVWKQIVTKANMTKGTPPTMISLVNGAMNGLGGTPQGGFETIVHLAFDREIVPRGGVLHKVTLLEGRTQMDPKMLEQMGYAVLDSHVVVKNDVPVGPAYLVLDYWGGNRQYKRWHLERPIMLNPSRNGNPDFMDENMIGFVAKWTNSVHTADALLALCELFVTGVRDAGVVAVPLVLELYLK